MTKFSSRLRELRSSKELSQQKLADIIGTSKSSINMYERGEREPGIEMLESFADYFNVDMNYLLGKTDVPNRTLLSFSSANISSQNINYQDNHEVLHLYNQLDIEDKAEIRGEMKHMLKADKYKTSNTYQSPPREIAAFGADGTKGTYTPPPREIT